MDKKRDTDLSPMGMSDKNKIDAGLASLTKDIRVVI
jgi:hypothetical protein